MESEKASTRNVVIDFLLQEHYHLTAFELYHELLEDGQGAAATKLHSFFSDSDTFPSEQMRALQGIDAQLLADEKEAAIERAAVTEYELRLAREDIKSLQEKLERNSEISAVASVESVAPTTEEEVAAPSKKRSCRDLGPLGDGDRTDLNCAVKEYLVAAGYKLTAMTFYEEVGDQDMNHWRNQAAHVPDALRRYYLSFLASTVDAAEERSLLLSENESLLKDKEALGEEVSSLTKSLESIRKEAKEKDRQIRQLRESLEMTQKELNVNRAEMTSLKLELESMISGRNHERSQSGDIPALEERQIDVNGKAADSVPREDVVNESPVTQSGPISSTTDMSKETMSSSGTLTNVYTESNGEDGYKSMLTSDELSSHETRRDSVDEKHETELQTVQVLADTLPKIVPYVLINHREELLPLIMCAIERHPEHTVRDSLTHTLFNLIKRPDEQQRRVIMDACVSLARNVGDIRSETELLPQCWEQINHKYEERRILVAQSCGELGQFVRAETRPSLILSIIQQLIEDEATVVREAAAQNLALLLPLFPDLDKFFKVEELVFQLVCDPAGIVVEASLEQLIPAVVRWAKSEKQLIHHLLSALISRLLGSVQRCPPLSGVQDSLEFQLRILGERERWVSDVLLRLLTQLLPEVRRVAIESCPFPDIFPEEEEEAFFSDELLGLYARANLQWPDFDWLPEDCFPALLHLACMLPPREEGLRSRLAKLLLTASNLFGGAYLMSIVLPIFLMAAGDYADTSHLSSRLANRIKGFKPLTPRAEQLARTCVLPLLLAGVYGAPNMKEGYLAEYLKNLVLQSSVKQGAWTPVHTPELIDAVRFLCTFNQQHTVIVGVLWELVVNPNANVKSTAAVLFKALVPYVDLKLAQQQVLPALVTLGSDPNLDVKYSSIEAFGTVAQHFKDEAVVDKIRVQMDAFLDDGDHEGTVAVMRALAAAVPHTTPSLRDYLLQKLAMLSGATTQGTTLIRRREKVDVFCEAIRALDATEISAGNVKDLLLPTIQNLLKDTDALDPAHKEALEVMQRERSGGRLESISKHLKKTSMGGLFGEGGYLSAPGSPSSATASAPDSPQPAPSPQPEEGRLKRMMRANFGEMIRGKS
ncbi:hypothetical protein Mp_1g00840 [Marchantia polymorpha subsp. ruderalis]|uniref:Cyclic nucleotide-binding domain-containing protein n=4 Tax=Marchantia polymorpha TaxID=3197 RepID=A0AAF6AK29_MARPO|nr:hypothetical protein MARPO_0103s0005 [Marchantia polymorpha]BBM96799.1 hypothetical protein Mp_1g00840 [Marchantia polymorpha subsp. ruderalis]|eukprot:PTQ32028.1 hypothetical protein MARPO_0103s0005 [Marchantia polymorpha]